ncbi:MAG TPA: helix-turn-helix domain-containing protein [Thermoanaerobaculia bacterium]|nr:helix-turn-helix domain-containing protein [Thermoanaerobaculia bacterium]
MDSRAQFVEAWREGGFSLVELCERYGVSRKTGYKWLRRWEEEGLAGLAERSRAPASCPHRTEERCEQALVVSRRKHPRWGARKHLWRLAEQHA